MASFLSSAVINRKTSINGTTLTAGCQKVKRLPFVALRLCEPDAPPKTTAPTHPSTTSTTPTPSTIPSHNKRAYFIETDEANYETLLATLHRIFIPQGRPTGQAYTDRALIVRTALYHTTQVQECIEHFVKIVSGTFKKIGRGQRLATHCQLGRIQFILLFSKIYRALVNDRLPRFDIRLEAEVQRDYVVDRLLPIRRLLFNLTDLWTTETTAVSYCAFLNDLLKQIINPRTLAFFHDEAIRCNPKKYNTALSWAQGYKILNNEEFKPLVRSHNVTAHNAEPEDSLTRRANQSKQTVIIPTVSEVDDYMQRFELNEDSEDLELHSGTSICLRDALSTRSLLLPLPSLPAPALSVTTSTRAPRSMQMITNENPIGMLNSIGLRPRKIVQVANEQYEVPIGATFTRRIKTDVTVSVLNERRGRLYLK